MVQGSGKWARAVLFAAVLVGTGCAGTAPARRTTGMAERPVRFVVENQNWMDMSIFLVTAAGARFRIGDVTTGQTAVFTIPAIRLGNGMVRLVGDPVGGVELAESDRVFLEPGATAHWRIGNQRSTSSTTVIR